VMPLGLAITVPSLNWIRRTVPELGRLQFSIDCQLKVSIITFFGSITVKFQSSSFKPPKSTTLARMTYDDVLRMGCAQRCKTRQKSNWLFAQTTHVDVAS